MKKWRATSALPRAIQTKVPPVQLLDPWFFDPLGVEKAFCFWSTQDVFERVVESAAHTCYWALMSELEHDT